MESGHVSWPSNNPVWEFDWTLADAPDQEGIVIRNARFKGQQVLYKGSLPSLRVQYDAQCGPYKDPLNFNNAHAIWGGNNRVFVGQYTLNGLALDALIVRSYHTIGSYKLTMSWIFWHDGRISPRLSSAGLQCNHDHRHHAYWRFDFDVLGAARDSVFEWNAGSPDSGWGPGWHQKTTEISRVKNPATGRVWAIMDLDSSKGYWIYAGSNDGTADAFSSHDLWIMRYRWNQDLRGQQGNAATDALDPYLNSEPVAGQDVVVWYCAHLGHEAHGGGDEWHTVGPNLTPFRWG